MLVRLMEDALGKFSCTHTLGWKWQLASSHIHSKLCTGILHRDAGYRGDMTNLLVTRLQFAVMISLAGVWFVRATNPLLGQRSMQY